jgi:hypothetical protein
MCWQSLGKFWELILPNSNMLQSQWPSLPMMWMLVTLLTFYQNRCIMMIYKCSYKKVDRMVKRAYWSWNIIENVVPCVPHLVNKVGKWKFHVSLHLPIARRRIRLLGFLVQFCLHFEPTPMTTFSLPFLPSTIVYHPLIEAN